MKIGVSFYKRYARALHWIVFFVTFYSPFALAITPYEWEFNQSYPTIKAAFDRHTLRLREIEQEIANTSSLASKLRLAELRRYLNLFYFSKTVQPLTSKYAWAIPNDNALAAIVPLSPIIEIGAGSGYWADLLERMGVDIIAYDNFSIPTPVKWLNVLEGDETKIIEHSDRTLFLCWPPKESKSLLAVNAIRLYKGEYLVYVGEGPGGVTAGPQFFEELDKNFEPLLPIQIPQWPGNSDQLTIYKRKTQ